MNPDNGHLLRVRNLTKHFRGLVAVNELSFDIRNGELVGLIGPNGAGKTTVFNLITGVHPATKGEIVFRGQNIIGKKPSAIAALGLVRTFQSNVLFDNQTCFENIMMSSHLHERFRFFASVFGREARRTEEVKIRERTEEILDSMALLHVKDQLAESLPQGLKRILGISAALAADPKLLLLDEPVTGMTHKDIQLFRSLIKHIKGRGKTILLVEHNLRLVMEICERIIVINFGNKIAEGIPEEIQNNQAVVEAYLGT
jgi:branched-chain amino acid transport system ATP-binding protein